ncbi:type II toxin-antitoxin system PemK/MazF family toxin [Candidatus Woesearchaeota archaeon]|nr:type II toxin-antitoxin system PemK/MazF family toxin [Candidatus Woesearchaeota archaeon]
MNEKRGYKTRPCVIIQNNQGNKMSPTTIISPISSQNIDFIYPFEILLLRKDSGLIKDSKINLAQINEAIKISLGIIDF